MSFFLQAYTNALYLSSGSPQGACLVPYLLRLLCNYLMIGLCTEHKNSNHYSGSNGPHI